MQSSRDRIVFNTPDQVGMEWYLSSGFVASCQTTYAADSNSGSAEWWVSRPSGDGGIALCWSMTHAVPHSYSPSQARADKVVEAMRLYSYDEFGQVASCGKTNVSKDVKVPLAIAHILGHRELRAKAGVDLGKGKTTMLEYQFMTEGLEYMSAPVHLLAHIDHIPWKTLRRRLSRAVYGY